MKTLMKVLAAALVLGFALHASPVRAAENASAGPAAKAEPAVAPPSATPAPKPDPAARVDQLEKMILQLQDELSDIKKQLSASPTVPPATKALEVSSVPAAPAPMPATAVMPAVHAADAPPANPFDSVAISGFVDGYYGYNFQHPQGPGGTQMTPFRYFEAPTSAFSLNMIELAFTKGPTESDRLGFNVTFGYGNAMNVVNSSDPAGLGYAQYLKEGYLSWLAPVGKGLQIDFGKFVTQHGAEVIETNANWNYSRSILFYYAIPYYHYGVRTKYVFNDKVNTTLYLVNGWNNIGENNTGKTFGLQVVLAPTKKLSIIQNYMVGPEQVGVNSNMRNLSDTLVTYNPTSKLSLMWNFDYGRQTPFGTSNALWWSGIAAYAKYAINDDYTFAARYEFYDDHSGSTTGVAQDLNEFTLTLDRTISKRLLTRWEFRRDMSNFPSMLKGSAPVTDQNTISGGLIYTFSIHDAK